MNGLLVEVIEQFDNQKIIIELPDDVDAKKIEILSDALDSLSKCYPFTDETYMSYLDPSKDNIEGWRYIMIDGGFCTLSNYKPPDVTVMHLDEILALILQDEIVSDEEFEAMLN